MKKLTKKGQTGLNDLLPVVLIFVVVGIAVTIGLTIQETTGDLVGTDQCAGYWNATSDVCQTTYANTTALSSNGAAFNASADAIEANSTIASYLPTLGLVVIAGIIIVVLLTMLMSRNSK